ncbi:MAG: hypothetical protein KGL39_04750 [Patescibacteria group bacterium]|nr:hypothetical protein [Patescibacteria group bacterium]
MGLDCSHDAWHGAYSAFMRWRTEIARLIGIPLELMEGFFEPSQSNQIALAKLAGPNAVALMRLITKNCPISWESLKPDPLHILLNHSDCDGEISPEDCSKIADRLQEILPLLPSSDAGGHIGSWRDKTLKFIAGCRAAAEANEPLDFH